MEDIEVCEKIIELCGDNPDFEDIKKKSKILLFAETLKHIYNLNIDISRIDNLDFNILGSRLGDVHITRYGVNTERHVYNTMVVPNDELLLSIQFPTGAYIFGGDYDKEFFMEFYNELRTYNPKYEDAINHYLYFSMDNAYKIYNNYDNICNKYIEKYRSVRKKNQAQKLKNQIRLLEEELKEIEN